MSKLNIVFDLDNTLICSLSEKEMEKYSDISGLEYKDMKGYYRIFQRPFLREFLDDAFEKYDITIWTAASKDYALFIIDNIILPKSKRDKYKIKMFFYDDHCDQSQKLYHKESPKDLRYLYNFKGYHPCNTIIIDDLYEVYKANPKHIIRAPYFDAKKSTAKDDRFLFDLHTKLDKIREAYETTGCKHHYDEE